MSKYWEAKIPFEGFFFDIEYMDAYKNFEVDKIRFPTMLDLINDLHNHHQRAVFIVDAGIGINDNLWYDGYSKQNVFIKSNKYPTANDGNLIG